MQLALATASTERGATLVLGETRWKRGWPFPSPSISTDNEVLNCVVLIMIKICD